LAGWCYPCYNSAVKVCCGDAGLMMNLPTVSKVRENQNWGPPQAEQSPGYARF
jgi:hypothetical protein